MTSAAVATRSRRFPAVALLAVWCALPGRSPRDTAAEPGASGDLPPITIVREEVPDDMAAYLKMMRLIVTRCQEARAGIAQAQGRSYDPKSDAVSDGELTKLHTEVIEEYFDGERYAKVVTYSQFDDRGWGPPLCQTSCRLKGRPKK